MADPCHFRHALIRATVPFAPYVLISRALHESVVSILTWVPMKISRSRNIGFDQARKTPAQMGWRFLLRYPSPPPRLANCPKLLRRLVCRHHQSAMQSLGNKSNVQAFGDMIGIFGFIGVIAVEISSIQQATHAHSLLIRPTSN